MKFKLTRLSYTALYIRVILYRSLQRSELGEMHCREGHCHQRRTRCRLELSRREGARMCVCVRASCINPVGMIYGSGRREGLQLFAGQLPPPIVRTYSFGRPALRDRKLACQSF